VKVHIASGYQWQVCAPAERAQVFEPDGIMAAGKQLDCDPGSTCKAVADEASLKIKFGLMLYGHGLCAGLCDEQGRAVGNALSEVITQ
jgi:hypothetical protein